MTQYNLGTAYDERIRGERAENLEAGDCAYEQALEAHPRCVPRALGRYPNNLGDAYRARIRGNRAENLEAGNCCYQQALEVYTREAYQQWASPKTTLAMPTERIHGSERRTWSRRLAYQQALEVYTRHIFPEKWATTQNNLGNAYIGRIRGERAENLEQAIACFPAGVEGLYASGLAGGMGGDPEQPGQCVLANASVESMRRTLSWRSRATNRRWRSEHAMRSQLTGQRPRTTWAMPTGAHPR